MLLFIYQYHLGNIRVSFIKSLKSGLVVVKEENHYYPFGAKHENYNTEHLEFGRMDGALALKPIEPFPIIDTYLAYQYKYLGQERQEELGLNWDTFRYRNYDYAIGRFFGIDPIAEGFYDISTYQFAHNNPIWKVELEGLEGVAFQSLMAIDATKNANGISAHVGGFAKGLVNSAKGLLNAVTNPGKTLKGLGNTALAAAAYSPNPMSLGTGHLTAMKIDNALGSNAVGTGVQLSQSMEGAYNAIVSGNGEARGEVLGEIAGAVIGAKGMNAMVKGLAGVPVANPVPNTLARVIPANVEASTLGAAGAENVFVTAASDISGMNASQIANKLTIPQSSSGFQVIEFPTPSSGLSTPIQSASPGFIGGGRTLGGAREFTIPNGPIPETATSTIVH